MAYEQREGGGALFKNDRKQRGSSQPDYKGNALVNGVEMDVAAWVKEGRSGKFFSLSIKPKRDFGGGGSKPSRPMPDQDDGLAF